MITPTRQRNIAAFGSTSWRAPMALPPNDRADSFTASIEPHGRFSLYYNAVPTGDFAYPRASLAVW